MAVRHSGSCGSFSTASRQPPHPAAGEGPGIHASGAGARDRFPSVPNAGEGFRAAGSGGVHPRREAGRKQHAQRTRYLRRNARIKPQGKFFLPDQADEDKQGSQQKPGSRNVVFISHACQQSQCHYASPLAETLFSRLPFSPFSRFSSNSRYRHRKPSQRAAPQE